MEQKMVLIRYMETHPDLSRGDMYNLPSPSSHLATNTIHIHERTVLQKMETGLDWREYYGLAIRQNAHDKEETRRAIWAMFDNKCSADDNPQHGHCPERCCSYLQEGLNKPGVISRHPEKEFYLLEVSWSGEIVHHLSLIRVHLNSTRNHVPQSNACLPEPCQHFLQVFYMIVEGGTVDHAIIQTWNDMKKTTKAKILQRRAGGTEGPLVKLSPVQKRIAGLMCPIRSRCAVTTSNQETINTNYLLAQTRGVQRVVEDSTGGEKVECGPGSYEPKRLQRGSECGHGSYEPKRPQGVKEKE
ncbi:hypothetical protein J437_LFUL011711 [Ladona fulva]|uniref:Uncharacterized protein n=1 Tax=Ladona fulva TaxID=123851 RepID=A0A8K0PBR9_LADFU|nr:hypothetical protein J437_LFUL011711 [Ladona fulva]